MNQFARRSIEDEIERLIGILDLADDDPDMEPDLDDEPETWLESHVGRTAVATDADDREDVGDDEPTLGAPERYPHSQEHLVCGVLQPRGDGLVWRERGPSQVGWAAGDRSDSEREVEDENGGDILDEPHDEDTDTEWNGDEFDYDGSDTDLDAIIPGGGEDLTGYTQAARHI